MLTIADEETERRQKRTLFFELLPDVDELTESFNYCCNYRIVNVVGIMPRKKTPIRKSKLVVCSMCGKTIPKKDISFVKTFDGFAYSFDSDDCLLIFRKLRDVYGKNFFRPSGSG